MHHIVGSLTLTSHARQTAPDSGGGKSETIKTRIFDSAGNTHDIPFITSNSLRGLFRRRAAEIILNRLRAKNQLVPRQLFQILTRGAHRRDGVGMQGNVEEMVAGARHVMAGLFGGGPTMVHSRYTIGALYPMVGWCERMLHPRLRDQMIPSERLRAQNREGGWYDIPLVTKIIMAPRDDLLAGKGQEYIEDYQTSLGAWLEEVGAGRAAKAEAKKAAAAAPRGKKAAADSDGAKSVDLSNFTEQEVMLPGTPLQFWLSMRQGYSDAQLGLMLMTVRDWANMNQLGGNSSQGFGRFNADLALYDGDTCVVDHIFQPGEHSITYSLSPKLDRYIKAAETELDAITVDELNSVFPWQALDAQKAKKAAKTEAA